MADSDHAPDDGKQVPPRPHDTGSQANETVDGLDAETEALRHATEDAPTGPGKIGKTPVLIGLIYRQRFEVGHAN